MSTPINITSTFDGTTVTDLSGAVQDPATRVFNLATAVAGLLQLWTFGQVGARDWFIQAISAVIPEGGAGSVLFEVVFPTGLRVPVAASISGNFALATNLVVPQGSLLAITTLTAAGAPAPSVVQMWPYGVNDKTFSELSCCHQNAPSFYTPYGSMAFSGNLGGVATVNPGAGTFVRIGAGAPGHPLFVSNIANRLVSVQGLTTATQELVYDWSEKRCFCVRVDLSLQDQAIGAEGFELRLVKNGVPIPNTTVQGQTGGLITSSGFIHTESLVDLNRGDVVYPEFANITSGANLTASSAIVTAQSA